MILRSPILLGLLLGTYHDVESADEVASQGRITILVKSVRCVQLWRFSGCISRFF